MQARCSQLDLRRKEVTVEYKIFCNELRNLYSSPTIVRVYIYIYIYIYIIYA